MIHSIAEMLMMIIVVVIIIIIIIIIIVINLLTLSSSVQTGDVLKEIFCTICGGWYKGENVKYSYFSNVAWLKLQRLDVGISSACGYVSL